MLFKNCAIKRANKWNTDVTDLKDTNCDYLNDCHPRST
jgi:hypothetical protein